jgi:hypothetical protein
MPVQADLETERSQTPLQPRLSRTPEERQLAMDAFIASVRDTDEATQAEIETGIDQMLERIYEDRIPLPDTLGIEGRPLI